MVSMTVGAVERVWQMFVSAAIAPALNKLKLELLRLLLCTSKKYERGVIDNEQRWEEEERMN